MIFFFFFYHYYYNRNASVTKKHFLTHDDGRPVTGFPLWLRGRLMKLAADDASHRLPHPKALPPRLPPSHGAERGRGVEGSEEEERREVLGPVNIHCTSSGEQEPPEQLYRGMERTIWPHTRHHSPLTCPPPSSIKIKHPYFILM